MSVEQWILVYLVFTARSMLTFSLVRPLRQLMPFAARLAASAALAVAAMGSMPEQAPAAFALDGSLLEFSANELLLAVIRTLPLAVAMESFAIAGRLVDVARGAQFAEQVLPNSGARVSFCEQLALHASTLILCCGFGAEFIAVLLPEHSVAEGGFSVAQIERFADALSCGVCLAAPVLLVSLVLDIAAAFASRALGRVNLLFEMLPAKLVLGVLLLTWRAVGGEAEAGIELLRQGLHDYGR